MKASAFYSALYLTTLFIVSSEGFAPNLAPSRNSAEIRRWHGRSSSLFGGDKLVALQANKDSSDTATNIGDQGGNDLMRYLYGAMWAGEYIYSYTFGPGRDGTFFPAADLALVSQLFDPTVINSPPPGSGLGLLGLLSNSFLVLPVVWYILLQEEAISMRQRRVPVWPFSLLSFGMGSESLFLYMALRQKSVETPSLDDSSLLRIFESTPIKATLALVAAFVFFSFAIPFATADWASELEGFEHLFDTSQFVSTSGIDFLLSNIFILDPIITDAKRRGVVEKDAALMTAIQQVGIYLFPFVGPVAWIVSRPSLGSDIKYNLDL